MGTRTVRRLGAALVVPLLVLTACTDEPEPQVAPPSSGSTSTAPTQSAEPEPWEEKSKEGAVAFAEHWMNVFNAAAVSGDVAKMQSLSTDACGSCKNFVSLIADVYGSGGSFEGGAWHIVQAVPGPDSDSSEARIALRIKQEPQVQRNGDGSTQEFAGGRVSYSAHLVWRDSAWSMNELVLVE